MKTQFEKTIEKIQRINELILTKIEKDIKELAELRLEIEKEYPILKKIKGAK